MSGVSLLNRLNVSASESRLDRPELQSIDHVEQAFAHFFKMGAPAERHTSDAKTFNLMLSVAEREMSSEIEVV